MESLPQELLEVLFSYCNVKDLLNVACCSKLHHSLLKPILWQCVKINLTRLTGSLGSQLTNLKYTTKMKIYDTLDFFQFKEEYGSRWLENRGMLLERLLTFCDPSIVKYLETSLHGPGLECVLERLCRVRKLVIKFVKELDGEMANRVLQVEELYLSYCFSLHDNGLKDLISGENLRKLKIESYYKLINDAFGHIGEKKGLEHLDIMIYEIPDDAGIINARPLGALTKLTYLRLYSANITNEDLQHLCRSLTQLRTLDLSSSRFADEGLIDISSLTSLSSFHLDNCDGITTHCFGFLVNLPLSLLSFSSDISSHANGFIDEEISKMNEIPTLKEVRVACTEFCKSKARNLMVNSLCSDGRWIVKFSILKETERRVSYTFTR